jgi:microcystin-dependent protein
MISFLPTVATGDTWSASQHNTYIRDNILTLFPYISAGDLAYASSSTALARLAIGAAGRILYSTGSAPAWMAAGAAGELLKGAGAAAPAWLAKPTVDSLLQNTAGGALGWVDKTSIQAQFPTGSIILFGGLSIPTGWLACNGSGISRTTYATLFGAISIYFGAGDGSTTFNVPDMRGRSPIGSGTGDGLTNRVHGSKSGEENHVSTLDEMPEHTHTYSRYSGVQNTLGGTQNSSYTTTITLNTSAAGGGAAHNNMQPWQAVNFIIKY